jgi:hypothetical protein
MPSAFLSWRLVIFDRSSMCQLAAVAFALPQEAERRKTVG